MKTLKVTRGFNQLLNVLRATHIDEYKTVNEILIQLIVGKNTSLMHEALVLSKTIKENKEITALAINNKTSVALKVIQTRYRERYGKVVSLGEIAESLCTKSLRSHCYRELMDEIGRASCRERV